MITMIDFPMTDSHLHVWDPAILNYPWLDSVPSINKRFVLEDYRKAVGRFPVDRMVFVQCDVEASQSGREVDWVSELARVDPRIQGIVAFAPLENADVEPVLDQLASNKLVKGIRRLLQSESDPAYCLRPDFLRGVNLLPKYNLSFDICVKGPVQLKSTIDLVRQCPEVRFVLDHIGKPRIIDPVNGYTSWSEVVCDLAALPNVFCKISGLVGEADLERWTPDDLRPYIRHTLDCFGIDRVMFGGDWPVVLLASTLDRWIEVLSSETQGLPHADRMKLFRENAGTFYRL